MAKGGDTWKGWWQRIAGSRVLNQHDAGSSDNDPDSPKSPGRPGTLQGLLLVFVLGVGLMVFSERQSERPVTSSQSVVSGPALPAVAESSDTIDRLQREVTLAITQIAGVGRAEVLIVPKTSEIKVFAQEVTRRSSTALHPTDGRTGVGQSSEESLTTRPVIVTNDATKSQEPLVEFVKRPELAGVLIVADGADDPRIRLQLLRAVAAVLDVPAHRIEVMARKE